MFLVLSTTGHLSLFPLLFQAQGKEKKKNFDVSVILLKFSVIWP